MSAYLALSEPLSQETAPSSSRKVLAFVALLSCVGGVALWTQLASGEQSSTIDMIAGLTQPAIGARPSLPMSRPMQSAGVSQFMSPTRALPAQAMPSAQSMQAYSPYDGKKYETLSYLPPMDNTQIEKQIRYMIANGWAPALEFSDDGDVYLNTRMGPGYYDNRYWSMYKLPMFGITDPSQVVNEIEACKREYPSAKIRVVAYDSIKQVQTAAFIVKK